MWKKVNLWDIFSITIDNDVAYTAWIASNTVSVGPVTGWLLVYIFNPEFTVTDIFSKNNSIIDMMAMPPILSFYDFWENSKYSQKIDSCWVDYVSLGFQPVFKHPLNATIFDLEWNSWHMPDHSYIWEWAVLTEDGILESIKEASQKKYV